MKLKARIDNIVEEVLALPRWAKFVIGIETGMIVLMLVFG